MIYSVKLEEGVENVSSVSGKPLERAHVIHRLNSICGQLEKWAGTKKPVHPIRVKLYRCAIYGYSVMLNAMKDEELEMRVERLEEIVQKGVVIPVEQESAKATKRY